MDHIGRPDPVPLSDADHPARPRAGAMDALGLALRLAWRQLRSDRARLMTAVAGVMFACVLVFMQLGFKGALFDSATNLLNSMRADLFLMHPMTEASFRPEHIPRARAWQALADADVAQAVPIYMAQASMRNPESGRRRTVQVIGLDVTANAVRFEGLAPLTAALTRPDTFAFDNRSRPEFGPVGEMFAAHGPFRVQIGTRMFELVGMIDIGPSFGADGNAVMSEVNFRRIFSRDPAQTDLVALRLRPGADLGAVQARLQALLPDDVLVLTHPELVAAERAYWENGTPIGFIFLFGSVMGLVVGMVIVYQILFADIAGHLSEYATLKAMGYSNLYLSGVVLGAAIILAVIGFIPGFVTSLFLYDVVAKGTFLPLGMPVERAVGVFALIFGMCFTAGLLAMRKLRDANPADMF
ncbi:ABC transporter permease DevC [Rhodovarius lipocyclicus]|uniref:ABC transporter permease DevC n=1 Tax=Rhodovarius lipocyclicus TaxID=268410 RepID=UPI001F2111A6|nr:ABC transporter permease DevC [Rhodovarius lipocyclicus]